ncbi:hypothetical protein [Streptomyces shaanxiensis]
MTGLERLQPALLAAASRGGRPGADGRGQGVRGGVAGGGTGGGGGRDPGLTGTR